MKLLVFGFLVGTLACMVRVRAPVPRRTQLVDRHNAPAKDAKRKLFLEDLDGNIEGSGSMEQNGIDRVNIMKVHNKRNAQLREVGFWFGDVDSTIDKFRDQISRKLDDLNNSLQLSNEEVVGNIASGGVPSQMTTTPINTRIMQNPYGTTASNESNGSKLGRPAGPTAKQGTVKTEAQRRLRKFEAF